MHPIFFVFLPFLVFTLCGGEMLHPNGSPTYVRRDDATGDSLICDKCPPGKYLLKHCTKSSKSVCGPCPNYHYTEVWNYIEQCQYCSRFCTFDEIESVPCTQFHNRQCECKNGFYRKHGSCLKHRMCPPGEGVISNGTAHTDVKCETCAEGLFSAESSSNKACQKFSMCAQFQTPIPGNVMNDVYCSECKNGSRTHADEAICDKEVIQFISMQILSPKKHKRLVYVLRRNLGENSTNKESVLELLTTIKNQSTKTFAFQILDILKTRRLLHLRNKIMNWFPHMTS